MSDQRLATPQAGKACEYRILGLITVETMA